MVDLKNIPMLYRRAPFDTYHAHILNELQHGKISPLQAAAYFEMPGVGFHRSLWILTNHLVQHAARGQQTFVVPRGMQQALSRTSLEGVTADEVKLPFPSLYIALPDYDREVWGGRTGWHKIRGVFIWKEVGVRSLVDPSSPEAEVPEDDKGMLHLYIWGEENAASHGRGDDASMWFAMDVNESFARGEDLERYLERILGDRSREVKDYNDDVPEELASLFGMQGIPQETAAFLKQKEDIIDAIRVAFNTMIYLSSSDPDVQEDPSTATSKVERADIEKQLGRMKNLNKGKGRRLRKRLQDLPRDTVTWVGRSVGRQGGPTGAPRGKGGPQRVHWVRGHWWPRKDTIRARLLKAHEEVAPIVAHYYDLEAEGGDPEGLEAARQRVQEAEDRISQMESDLIAKRRWVAPYQKGSVGSAPASHTYVLKE